MGFMKRGLSIMAIFWSVVFFAAFVSLGPLLFILPILWCYSFFNVHNIRGMSDEEFYALEDDYLFHLEAFDQIKWKGKLNNLFAGGLILVGVVILWQYLCDYLSWMLPETIYWGFVHDIPQVVIAVLLIFSGIYLIRGKKKDLDSKEQYYEEWQDMPERPDHGSGEQAESGNRMKGKKESEIVFTQPAGFENKSGEE